MYILRCVDGTLYTGITNHIQQRLCAHNQGKGAKYTRGRTPVEIVYLEKAESRSFALQRERTIKKMQRMQKEKLIATHAHLWKEWFSNHL